MKRILIYICTFLLLSGISVYAQDVNSINSTMNNLRLKLFSETTDFDSPEFNELYEGSPFLQKEWQIGKVMLISGEIREYTMRYFVYGNQMWLKNKTDSIRILNLSEQIAEIRIADQTFVYTAYREGDKRKQGILEMLYSGKNCKLYHLHICQFLKGREANGYQEKEKDKFQLKQILYYQLGEGEIMALPRSRKDVFAIFTSKKSLMEKYSKENKLKMNPQDICKIFSYYDLLEE